ncbi:MAG TPA: hypothetical protein VJN44_00370 [Roseateles sp.]|nr:hypothetical protein [Roseateles sp.]
MKIDSYKRFLLAGLGLAGALCAGAASARGGDEDIRWSVTIGSDMPVYSRQAPVYASPAYPRYVAPHSQYQQPTRWDRDGDGIPNRRDRLYNPVWDRDGDGVPNRYDRYDRYGRHDRYDRDDHDGWRR